MLLDTTTSAHADDSLVAVARALAELGRVPLHTDFAEACAEVTRVAAERVTGAEWVSITVQRAPGKFTTAAASDERARAADAIQYKVGHGPCVDAIVDDTIYCPADLPNDPRWPVFGRRAADQLGVGSMLSFRLSLNGGDLLGCLNHYATRPHAFDAAAVVTGEIIATHAAAVISAVGAKITIDQLHHATRSNRDIGVGIGVLMHRYKITADEAFDLLRVASQNSNRKLRDVAQGVVETGELALLRPA